MLGAARGAAAFTPQTGGFKAKRPPPLTTIGLPVGVSAPNSPERRDPRTTHPASDRAQHQPQPWAWKGNSRGLSRAGSRGGVRKPDSRPASGVCGHAGETSSDPGRTLRALRTTSVHAPALPLGRGGQGDDERGQGDKNTTRLNCDEAPSPLGS